jgi:two-component system, NarL family, response regulator YdfI
MIRVLIRASSRLAKAGLESLLRSEPALQLVEDSRELGVDTDSPPEVLLVETDTLADAAAREAVELASAGGPVVLLVRTPASEPVAEALRAGVKAVLPNRLDGPEIVAAVQAAAAGMVVLDPSSLETVLQAPAALAASGSLIEELTSRELEVLRLVAAGLGNKQIAARLDISEHTVKFHIASIMSKLGAGSRTEAVTLGIRHGLIMI